MVKVIERDWDDTETPNEKKDKLYRALQSSLGVAGGILVLNLECVISIDHGNIELLPQQGIIALYPIDPTEQYRVLDANTYYPHFSLAERVAAVYTRETGEEAVIFRYGKRVKWAEEAVLERIRSRNQGGIK